MWENLSQDAWGRTGGKQTTRSDQGCETVNLMKLYYFYGLLFSISYYFCVSLLFYFIKAVRKKATAVIIIPTLIIIVSPPRLDQGDVDVNYMNCL